MEHPYNRLMVIYRKAKEYDKELTVINKALDVFTELYDKKKEPFAGRGKVAQLSKAYLNLLVPKRAIATIILSPYRNGLKEKQQLKRN